MITTGPDAPHHLDRIAAEHAIRGAALHVRLRAVLVVFAIVTVWWEPPEYYATACLLLAVGYGIWAAGLAVWLQRDPAHLVRLTWLVLTADLLLFGVLNLLVGVSDRQSWTPFILQFGFLLLPILAAGQLQLRLAGLIGAGTTVLYLISSIAARPYNGDPGAGGEHWSSVVMRTVLVAAISLGAVLLTQLQRGRVADIGRLAGQRAELLGQLGRLEDRERRDLAEALHDGALQYLLGARLELEEARDAGDGNAFDRVDEALTAAVGLLRATVGELHPAVLAQAGLAQALRDLARNTETRSRLTVQVTIEPPGDDTRGPADLLAYSAVREMLVNVVKHAAAQSVRLTLRRTAAALTVVVADDGRGIEPGAPERQLAAGHIGIAAHRVRLEAAGGSLTLAPNRPHGTVATVTVPLADHGRANHSALV